MKCVICQNKYTTTIAMQTIGKHGLVCHYCLHLAVEKYIEYYNYRGERVE